MSVVFGKAIAELADDPIIWAEPITLAYAATDEKRRNYGLLAGYYSGLAAKHHDVVLAFKRNAIHSHVLAPVLPFLCLHLGIDADDVALVCQGLKSGTVPARTLSHWRMGGIFAKLEPASAAPLFDQMLTMDGVGYAVALDVMSMFVYGAMDRLEQLRSQIMLAVKNIGRRPKRGDWAMNAHHFEQVVGWLLKKGRDDGDARVAATRLAHHLATDPKGLGSDLIKPLLPVMFEHFAAAVWPVFGNAIVKDRATAWHIEHALGDGFSFADEKKPSILRVPDDILFSWAHANPDGAPAFLARTFPVLTTRAAGKERTFHPLMKRLLDEFGDRDDVRRSVMQNIHSFGWTGSLTTYFALYEEPLQSLFEHPTGALRRWAKTAHSGMRKQIESAKRDDDERDAMWNA